MDGGLLSVIYSLILGSLPEQFSEPEMYANGGAYRPSCGGYGWTGMTPKKLSRILKESTQKIHSLHQKLKFDAIAFTGASGACLGFTAGGLLGIPLIYIRKEQNHHGVPIEYNGCRKPICRYLIVDDFIAGGSTVDRILEKIKKDSKDYGESPECVGIFLYWKNSGKSYHGIPIFGPSRIRK